MILHCIVLFFHLFSSPFDEAPARVQDPPSEDTIGMTQQELRYWETIQHYRSGDFQWAVEKMSSFPIDKVASLSDQLPRLGDELKELVPKRSVTEADCRTAVLLHTQVAILSSNQRDPSAEEAHSAAALSIFKYIRNSSFRRRWLLALGFFPNAPR